MSKIVLIIGQHNDAHIERVSSCVRDLGAVPILFDFVTDYVEMSVVGGKESGYVRRCGSTEKICFESIHSVWYYLKHQCDVSANTAAERSEARFAWNEWIDLVNSLPQYVAPHRWINPRYQSQLMGRKGVQYELAKRVGLRIPVTSITNDYESVLHLFELHERLIYKPLTAPVLTDDRMLFTTEIAVPNISSAKEEIQLAPGIYQEFIESDYEIRATIVGERVFAAKFQESVSGLKVIDRREVPLEMTNMSIEVLDSALTHRLLEFHRSAGLVYGAYDLIVPKCGEPVFLEVNPGGNWIDIEDKLNLPISQELAVNLVGDS